MQTAKMASSFLYNPNQKKLWKQGKQAGNYTVLCMYVIMNLYYIFINSWYFVYLWWGRKMGK